MAYDATVAQPVMIAGGVGLGPRIWTYSSVDAVTLVRVAGYFTDGWSLGMRKNDIVLVLDNDASPITGSWCWVSAASSTSVDLSDGVTITGTNTD
jgi:hypothetical protein